MMIVKRTYDDGCPSAHALDLVGDRWALIIARELLFGPKRFTDLRNSMPRMSPNVLAQRLRELTQRGIIHQLRVNPYTDSHAYELTEWGHGLEPVILSLARWGSHSPGMPWERPRTSDGVLMTLKAFLDPAAAATFEARVMLWLEDAQYGIVVSDGEMQITHAEIDQPEVLIRTERATLLEMLAGTMTPQYALLANQALVAGDIAVFRAFLTLFPGCPLTRHAAAGGGHDHQGTNEHERHSGPAALASLT